MSVSGPTGAVRSRAAVVMPVYNEQATVAGVLDAVRARFGGEVIVVDDGSSDGTSAILQGRSDVRVITLPTNKGYGAALSSGFHAAVEDGMDAVITMDCDGQHEPRHITEFLEEIARGDADIVSGSRYLPGSVRAGSAPGQRREVNRIVTAEVNSVTGWGITDAFCGFKAYLRKVIEGATFEEQGYAMPMELWAQAWRRGLRVKELPVERIYFDHDRSFGEDLDDPEKRLRYYQRVWRESLQEAKA